MSMNIRLPWVCALAVLTSSAWADARSDANAKTVREFYEADGLKSYLAFMKDKFPKSHSEIKRVLTDGDYVILHVHAVREPGTLGQAIIDIFRLENGKIVEHWDVIQDIPDKPANGNGMF
jgi:predicted SnoaL-like aldol condensation-catalyzing enzyme